MRKDSKIFLAKALDYAKKIGDTSFEVNISYFKDVPNISICIEDILKDLVENNCITSQSKVNNLEGYISIYLTLAGFKYFNEIELSENNLQYIFNVFGGQVNVANDNGQINIDAKKEENIKELKMEVLELKEKNKERSFTDIVDSFRINDNRINKLYFKCQYMKFYGRERELSRLEKFLDSDENILIYTICGEQGVGKSKLAYSFIQQQIEQEYWKMIFIDGSILKKINSYNEYYYKENLLIVIDNISKAPFEFAEWLSFILQLSDSNLPPKLRLLLLDRTGVIKDNEFVVFPEWYQIILDNYVDLDYLSNFVYNFDEDFGFFRLKGLGRKEIIKILDDYSRLFIKDNNKIKEDDFTTYIKQKCDDIIMNPMIMIMGLINEFTDDKSIEEYFFDNKDFIVRKICKSDKKLYDAMQKIIIYINVVGRWEIGKESSLPAYFADAAFYILGNIDELELKKFICAFNEQKVFEGDWSAIKPDIISEIVVIKYLERKLLNRRFLEELIKEIASNNFFELLTFCSDCTLNLKSDYCNKIINKITDYLKETQIFETIPINRILMTNQDHLTRLKLVYYMEKANILPEKQTNGRMIFKSEVLRMFLKYSGISDYYSDINCNTLQCVCLFRECQRKLNDIVTNPIYLENAIPYLKSIGFSNDFCDIVKNSSIYIYSSKSVESYIVSLVDFFSEEFLNDNDIDSILKDIHEIQTSDEKQKNIKMLFINFIILMNQIEIEADFI